MPTGYKNMKKIIIIGCGGLAKIVADILRENNQFRIEGFIDTALGNKSYEGIKVIGTDNDLPGILKSGITSAAVGIGSINLETNTARVGKFERIRDLGFDMPNIIQNGAYISSTARLGKGNIIVGNCYIGPMVSIGSGTIMHPFTSIEHDSIIGDYIHFSQGAKVAGDVKIGKGSFIGMGAAVIQGMQVPENTFVKSGGVYFER